MTKKELLQLHEELTSEALEIMRKKNQDYTGTNPDPFANFRGIAVAMGVEPEIGLMLRHGDKMQRVKSFIENGFLAVEDESLRDIAHDWINYGVLLYGMASERKAAIEEANGPVKAAVSVPSNIFDEETVPLKRKTRTKRKYTRKSALPILRVGRGR